MAVIAVVHAIHVVILAAVFQRCWAAGMNVTGVTETDHIGQRHPTERRAFVTIAHDPPGKWDHFPGVLAMARAIQRVSSYPLVVLTNMTFIFTMFFFPKIVLDYSV